MRAGISTRKQRKDCLLFDTLDLVRCTIDSNTQVSPVRKDIIWVRHARTGCRYRHPKHIQHITDTALLGVMNDAIKPLDIGIDKLRKIKRRMGYIRRAGFRACLCVVCLVIKLLLAACQRRVTRTTSSSMCTVMRSMKIAGVNVLLLPVHQYQAV
jgi:hypothetical protein